MNTKMLIAVRIATTTQLTIIHVDMNAELSATFCQKQCAAEAHGARRRISSERIRARRLHIRPASPQRGPTTKRGPTSRTAGAALSTGDTMKQEFRIMTV